MDIIDQLFPQTETADSKVQQYLSGQKPWEILQSVWDSSEEEMREAALRRTLGKIK